MCGICGELRFDGQPVREPDVRAMRDRLIHRGPDSDGLYLSRSAEAGLGFRRLRVIDLSSNASQPMSNEDGSIRLVFNGEIYNFRELRSALVTRGHQLRSQSDTEAIVHLYEDKGSDAIAELDGMFAIAIWDERERRLTLARDRVGKKPLFYYRDDRLFAFASEMKAFFALPDVPMELDPDSVPDYFVHGYVPGPATFYRRVLQLEPGTLMTVRADGGTTARRYWTLEYPAASEARPIDLGSAARGVRERVTRAIERRLVSDVPIGAFLGGGVDSTIVVGTMAQLMTRPVRTFSIGFEGDAAYDETSYARMAAERFKTEHTEFRVSPSAVDLIDTLVWHHDGPFGDSSAVPTYIVSRLTREHVTVVLTGDGGDELFAGYDRFRAALLSERIPNALGAAAGTALSWLPAARHDRDWLAKAQRFFRGFDVPLDERPTMWNALFWEVAGLLRPDFAAAIAPLDRMKHLALERSRTIGRTPLARMLHANFSSYLPDDLLVKTDRCTMAVSLEARSPLLDRELIEYAAGLPDSLKLHGGSSKVVLRHAFADLLPPAIRRRSKMGFGVPLGSWFRGPLRNYVRDVLLAPDARYREMLSGAVVENLVGRHLRGATNAGQQLWSLVCFERWLQLLPEWSGSTSANQPALANLNAD